MALQGVEAVVHLAGESLAAGRWSRARKGVLLASRVRGTRLLSETLSSLDPPPRVMVSASAIGIYGDRGGERLTESSPAGSGFLPGLVTAWERATGPAEASGIRVVRLRTALVMTARGGVLARLRLPFGLGLGGTLGSGRQWMSWITLDDLVRAIEFALATDTIAGPVNAAAPGAVTNLEFTRTLARVMGRPGFVRVPAAALRLALGGIADEALLASARVEPERLLAAGFAFRDPALEPALRALLGRPRAAPAPAG
ncbi:MAG TPA: TIGR01777 family oxidoreductase [Candidatus Eisenbacteria bacterium]